MRRAVEEIRIPERNVPSTHGHLAPNGNIRSALRDPRRVLLTAADEGTLTANDAPRYLMDGVFLYDFLGSGTAWTPDSAVGYAEHYFARYPALSLGIHPPRFKLSARPRS